LRQYLNKLVKGKIAEIIEQSRNGLEVRTLSEVGYLQG
jgi:predicted house-cleaning noncanonical NTP pyrophosphatase (MazG superfamily)